MPEIYLIGSPQLKAFAVDLNPEKTAVTITTGFLNLLDHELVYVKNRDNLIGTLAPLLLPPGALLEGSRPVASGSQRMSTLPFLCCS